MEKTPLVVLAAALLALTPLAGWAQAKWRITAADKPDGAGPWPLVMLIHGCGGIQGNIAMWQGVLREARYATIVVDGFSERGVQEICTDFRRVPASERVTDAFEALSSLKADPALDTNRAAIMGFSNGAVVAFDAANERTLRGYKYAPQFRASIALYPECKMRAGTQFGIPLLIGIGAADDWTLASSCQEVFDYSKGRAGPGRAPTCRAWKFMRMLTMHSIPRDSPRLIVPRYAIPTVQPATEQPRLVTRKPPPRPLWTCWNFCAAN